MERLAELDAVAERVVSEHRASPAAVVAIAWRRGGEWVLRGGAAGRLSFDAGAPPASLRTLFDLASVTKPVTALCAARLERRKILRRATPLGEVLPAARSTRSADVRLDLLLAHRAGLDGHRPLYAPLLEGRAIDRDEALALAADARREGCEGAPPDEGFAPVYSDLGYLLAGAAMEAQVGAPLDVVLAREVLDPLGLRAGSARALRAREGSFDAAVAPTEVVAWRGGAVRGAVHDENAWAFAHDAAAGHAGLFGDAEAVLRLGCAILDAVSGRFGDFLTAEEMEPLVRARPGGSLLAGFDRKSGASPSAGSRFGAATFGHLGFTGTSLWMDPEREIAGVLLTNRVHPSRATDAIRRARPATYDALAELAETWERAPVELDPARGARHDP